MCFLPHEKPMRPYFFLYYPDSRPTISSYIKTGRKRFNLGVEVFTNFRSGYILKVESRKLYKKYIIASTQTANTEVFVFMAVLVFKSLSRKVKLINRKDNRNY